MPSKSHDERLAELLAGLAETAREGQAPDIDAAARDHPELAVELRGLWAMAALADELAPVGGDGFDEDRKSVV